MEKLIGTHWQAAARSASLVLVTVTVGATSWLAGEAHLVAREVRARLGGRVPVMGAVTRVDEDSTTTNTNNNAAVAPTVQVLPLWSSAKVRAEPFALVRERERGVVRVGRYNVAGRESDARKSRAAAAEAPPILLPGGSPSALLVAGDDHCEPHLRTLDERYQSAIKAGVLAAPTPFVNGRAYTLMLNDDVLEGGLVGVALFADGGGGGGGGWPQLVHERGREARPLGPAVRILRSRGNIVVELEGDDERTRNPSQLLLDMLSTAPNNAGGAQLFAVVDDGPILRVVSGDPKRGPFALDTIRDVQPGQTLQFLLSSHEPSATAAASTASVDALGCLRVSGAHIFAAAPWSPTSICRVPGSTLSITCT